MTFRLVPPSELLTLHVSSDVDIRHFDDPVASWALRPGKNTFSWAIPKRLDGLAITAVTWAPTCQACKSLSPVEAENLGNTGFGSHWEIIWTVGYGDR